MLTLWKNIMNKYVLFILILFFICEPQAASNKCSSQIDMMKKNKDDLLLVLDKTKSYVKGNNWIYSNKQLEINGSWNEVDDVLENEEHLESVLPIINDKSICDKSTSLTISVMKYIKQSNLNIIRDINEIIVSAPEIMKVTGCNSQNSCDGFFGFYLQKKMNDYGFYQYGGLRPYIEEMKNDRKALPPVNLRKKEVVYY